MTTTTDKRTWFVSWPRRIGKTLWLRVMGADHRPPRDFAELAAAASLKAGDTVTCERCSQATRYTPARTHGKCLCAQCFALQERVRNA